jgi:hypothetical protein
MKVKILGKIWDLVFQNLGTKSPNWGFCDPPDTKNKKIIIHNKAKDLEKLTTIIHECLHAADWHKNEEWIEEVSVDLSRILWRLGYREKDNENS